MHNESFFIQALVYLTAAVVSVPIAKRLGLGSVLGYLIAGVLIGPFVLGWVGSKDSNDVMHFAEFGVVMMLFLVGLELQPSRLWKMRGPILGIGGMQVAVSAVAICGIALAFGVVWQMALAIGLTLALSSTAIVIQTLTEKGYLKTDAGQKSFAVLLFQDIAVIPILALLPLLATLHHGGDHHHDHAADGHHPTTWTEGLPGWGQALVTLAAVAVVILAGRFLIGHVFRLIAKTGLREIFTAAALLLVIAIAVLMAKVGLSPALGTFLAGVVLAESEYRHELESDIDPFKGLLLGLFFIAVGASIDFALIFSKPLIIVGLMAGLLGIKTIVLFVIGKVAKMSLNQNTLFAVALSQGGEFAFVLFAFATGNGILTQELAKPLIAAVALSMAVTPLLFILHEKLIQPRFAAAETDEEREPDSMDEDAPVIIAGFGRFGNVVGRFLRSCDVQTTVLEFDSDHVDMLRKLGLKVFYGDASRADLLHAAGAEKARLFILAVEQDDKSLEIVHTIRQHFPNLEILARASSRAHAYDLIEAGVDSIFLEQQASSLDLGVVALKRLGQRAHAAHRAALRFKQFDFESVHAMAGFQPDQKSWIDKGRERIADLEARMERDRKELNSVDEAAWDIKTQQEKF
ncbi:MAG: monovalent cation:proton antiporter-2 (CPA2) family protein [Verrucomicrobiota bacterium]